MYECLTGFNPFIQGCSHQGETLSKTLMYDPPVLSGVKGDLANLIHNCLKKAIHRRPPSAATVLKTLKDSGGA